VFLGRVQSTEDEIDYESVLDDLDWLLPLYEFVEGGAGFPLLGTPTAGFIFKPGCSIKKFSAVSSIQGGPLDIDLRHKKIQLALYRHLVSQHGGANVGTECINGGGFVDLVVRNDDRYWFYEVKTSCSARGCVRQALSQLLEYSLWPGSQEALKLIVVGEPPLDESTGEYLSILRSRFEIPIEYQQFVLNGSSS
jgi:hypothetical protein